MEYQLDRQKSKSEAEQLKKSTKMQPTHNHLKTNLEYIIWQYETDEYTLHIHDSISLLAGSLADWQTRPKWIVPHSRLVGVCVFSVNVFLCRLKFTNKCFSIEI